MSAKLLFRKHVAVFALLLLCGVLMSGCAGVRYGYEHIEPNQQYGTIHFASGPTHLELGRSADRRTFIGDIRLVWDSGNVLLPERTTATTFRELTIDGSDARWLKAYLFRKSGLTMQNPTIVFPEATEFRRVNPQVAEAVARVYPVRMLLKTSQSNHRDNGKSLETVEVATCLFSANAMRCYGVIEGPALNGVQDEQEQIAIVERAVRASASSSGFTVKRVVTKAGHFQITIAGRFKFEGGHHSFSGGKPEPQRR